MKSKLFVLVLVLVLSILAVAPVAAAPFHSSPFRDFVAGPCASGAAYDPNCDVNHDGNIDIYDIQLTASHWTQTGTYNIYPAMVPKTGQTVAYAAHDDGDLKKGVAWPNPRFTDNGNGTVTDNLTGLIWLKNASCYGTRVWATALTDANTLNSGECGLTDGSVQGDWRLPNVREMQSIVHYGFFSPAVPNTAGTGQWTAGNPFTGVQANFYWTSTTRAGFTSTAWYVFLSSGTVNYDGESFSYNVWPVRGGQ